MIRTMINLAGDVAEMLALLFLVVAIACVCALGMPDPTSAHAAHHIYYAEE